MSEKAGPKPKYGQGAEIEKRAAAGQTAAQISREMDISLRQVNLALYPYAATERKLSPVEQAQAALLEAWQKYDKARDEHTYSLQELSRHPTDPILQLRERAHARACQDLHEEVRKADNAVVNALERHHFRAHFGDGVPYPGDSKE